MLRSRFRPTTALLPTVLAALTFAFPALCGAAVPVQVELQWPGGAPAKGPGSITIAASRVAGYTAASQPLQVRALAGTAVLKLDLGIWRLQASASGYWGQPIEVTVSGSPPAAVRMSMWPAATLSGQVQTTDGETLPPRLQVRLHAAVGAKSGASASSQSPGQAALQCPITAGHWSCLAPAGRFDLRLSSHGFAPVYEWSVTLTAANNTDLGSLVLQRAASVFGRAVRSDGSSPQGSCQARLGPDPNRRGAPEDEPSPSVAARLAAPLNGRGYFQILGIPPGRYQLAIHCPGASGLRSLEVVPDRETRIDPPLRLGDLTLRLALTPGLDPSGHPWRVSVAEVAPDFQTIVHKTSVREAAAQAGKESEGQWLRNGLLPGKYHVSVTAADGSLWLQRYLDLQQGGRSLRLRLTAAKVAGRVLLGVTPVSAQLVFSNDAGGQTVTLSSDDNGRFQGQLPEPSGTAGATWTVLAHLKQPPATQRLLGVAIPAAGENGRAWLELRLPALAVRGTVVSAKGGPQQGIQVSFKNASGVQASTATDALGHFQMADLAAGKYTVEAESVKGASVSKSIIVTSGASLNLRLVLKPATHIPFQITSDQGPVAGATVQVWVAPGVPWAFTHSDQNGQLNLSLPPGTTDVSLTVSAPGYALTLTRIHLSGTASDSSDPHTVTLETSGGTLQLNFQEAGGMAASGDADPGTYYLIHKGAIQDARAIPGGSSAPTGDNGQEVIQGLATGSYGLCRVTAPAQLTTLWSGSLPSSICTTGSLDDGDTLTLSAP